MSESSAAASPPEAASPSKPSRTTDSPRRGRKRFLGRTVLTLAVCIAVLALGASAFQGLSRLKDDPPRTVPTPDVFQVEVYRVEAADVRRIISAFGAARADREVVVSAEVPGRIVRVDRLDVGRQVDAARIEFTEDGRSERVAGDVLVQIDPQVYRQRVAQAETLIAQDETRLRQLEQTHASNQRLLEQQRQRLATITEDYERKRELVNRGAGSETELRRVELEMKQYEEGLIRLESDVELYPVKKEELQRQRAVHESDLELAQLELEKTEVSPPFSGTIAEVMVEEGQYVQIGTPLFRITNQRRVEVPVAVPSRDSTEIAAELAAGRYPEAALAESESAPPRWFGNVMRIDPAADERTRTVMLYIEVENDEQDVPLRPGTFVQARIEGAVIEDALLVPRDAIRDRSLFVVAERSSVAGSPEEAAIGLDNRRPGAATAPPIPHQHAERREIRIAGTIQSFALLRSGVAPGDRIVLTNLDVMDEGTLLRVDGVRTLDDELERQDPAYAVRVDDRDPATPGS